MSTETVIISLATVAIGATFCFAGYRLFRIIIAVWGFFAGFLIGAQAVASLFGNTFLSSPLAWGVGIVLGLILAVLAYALYSAAIAILGASVGYLIGIGLMTALGFDSHSSLTFLAGIFVAILFCALILLLNLAKVLIIINTALGGASSIVLGVLLFLGKVPLSFLNTGLIGAFLKSSPTWGILWLAIAVIGFLFQMQSTRHYQMEKYTPTPAAQS
jgi:hypothetical protein